MTTKQDVIKEVLELTERVKNRLYFQDGLPEEAINLINSDEKESEEILSELPIEYLNVLIERYKRSIDSESSKIAALYFSIGKIDTTTFLMEKKIVNSINKLLDEGGPFPVASILEICMNQDLDGLSKMLDTEPICDMVAFHFMKGISRFNKELLKKEIEKEKNNGI